LEYYPLFKTLKPSHIAIQEVPLRKNLAATETVGHGLVKTIDKSEKDTDGVICSNFEKNIPCNRSFDNYGHGSTKANNINLKSVNKAGLITLTTINALLSISSISISIIMAYFKFKTRMSKSFVQVLYLRNGLADFFVGLGILLQTPLLYLMIWQERKISGITIPTYISYCITAIAVKMSVFMNCVLGVVRCINIVQPFYSVKKKALTVCTIMYTIIWSIIVGVDLWQFTVKRGTENNMLLIKTLVMKGNPGFGLTLLSMSKEQHGPSYVTYHLGNVVEFIIPITVPSFLCFVLMIVQIHNMPRKPVCQAALAETSKKGKGSNSKAGVTIFMLTCIYAGTSAIAIITWMIVHGRKGYLGSKASYDALVEKKSSILPWSDLIAIYFSLSTCPLICSTLTPLTLLLRGTGDDIGAVRRSFTTKRSSRAASSRDHPGSHSIRVATARSLINRKHPGSHVLRRVTTKPQINCKVPELRPGVLAITELPT
jgi:hypothetical protein